MHTRDNEPAQPAEGSNHEARRSSHDITDIAEH